MGGGTPPLHECRSDSKRGQLPFFNDLLVGVSEFTKRKARPLRSL